MDHNSSNPFNALSIRVLPTFNLNDLGISLNNNPRVQGRRFDLKHTTKDGHNKHGDIIFHDVFKDVKALAEEHIRTHNRDELETTLTFIAKMQTAESSIPTPELPECLYLFLTAVYRFFGKTPWFGTHAERLTKLENLVGQEIANLKSEEKTPAAAVFEFLEAQMIGFQVFNKDTIDERIMCLSKKR